MTFSKPESEFEKTELEQIVKLSSKWLFQAETHISDCSGKFKKCSTKCRGEVGLHVDLIEVVLKDEAGVILYFLSRTNPIKRLKRIVTCGLFSMTLIAQTVS